MESLEERDMDMDSGNSESNVSEIFDDYSDLSDDSDSSASSAENENFSFREELRHWALSSSVSHMTLNSLLSLLKRKTNLKIPKDARTLLKKPSKTSTTLQSIAGGQYWYQGIASCLKSYFR